MLQSYLSQDSGADPGLCFTDVKVQTEQKVKN